MFKNELRKPLFVVKVPGGLGNQLFVYFFSCYLSALTSSRVKLDFSSVDKTHYKNSIPLLEFNIDSNNLEISNTSSRLENIMQRNCIKRLKWIHQRIYFDKHQIFTPDKDSIDEFNRFLQELKTKKSNKILIEGYFGDFAFHDHLNAEVKALSLISRSENLSRFGLEFNRVKTIAIHHRLGDYQSLQSTMGLLGENYYREAIEKATATGGERCLVFSNEPELSKEIFRKWGFGDKSISWIGPQDLPSPAETLYLMSKASSIVCSNSTFSFWAAKLADEKKTTLFYPDSWRRDGKLSVRSIPLTWISIKSDWVSLSEF